MGDLWLCPQESSWLSDPSHMRGSLGDHPIPFLWMKKWHPSHWWYTKEGGMLIWRQCLTKNKTYIYIYILLKVMHQQVSSCKFACPGNDHGSLKPRFQLHHHILIPLTSRCICPFHRWQNVETVEIHGAIVEEVMLLKRENSWPPHEDQTTIRSSLRQTSQEQTSQYLWPHISKNTTRRHTSHCRNLSWDWSYNVMNQNLWHTVTYCDILWHTMTSWHNFGTNNAYFSPCHVPPHFYIILSFSAPPSPRSIRILPDFWASTARITSTFSWATTKLVREIKSLWDKHHMNSSWTPLLKS